MDIGQPEVFDSKDEGERLAYKLSSTFRRIWNNFGNINKQLSKSTAITSTIVNDHTSAMPDIHGVNPDHDKRYFRKSEIKNLVGNIYYLSSYSSLTAALAAIGSTDATLVIGTDGTKDSTAAWPTNIKIFWAGGKITSTFDYTMGEFLNNPQYQIFDGSGQVTLNKVTHVNPLWFATNTTPGTTSMTAAFQAAVDSVAGVYGCKLFIPNGEYLCGKITVDYSGLEIEGESMHGTVIKPVEGAADYVFYVNLDPEPPISADRPFYFSARKFTILGDLTGRTQSGFYLKHVLTGGMDNILFRGLNKCIHFVGSFWCSYDTLWLQDYNVGFDAESAALPGNQNNFKNINFFDGNTDDSAIPIDTTYMSNCLWDGCCWGCSKASQIDTIKIAGSDSTFLNCRWESIRCSGNAAITVSGNNNTFITPTFTEAEDIGSPVIPETDPPEYLDIEKYYIDVTGHHNTFDALNSSFYGKYIRLQKGSYDNTVKFIATDYTTPLKMVDYGDNKIIFGNNDYCVRDHYTGLYQSWSDFRVTNLITFSRTQQSVYLTGLTKAADADLGPYGMGEVYKYTVSGATREARWYIGVRQKNTAYGISFFAKAVSGVDNIEEITVSFYPIVTSLYPRTIRDDCWTRVTANLYIGDYGVDEYLCGLNIILGETSNGVLICAPQVVCLGDSFMADYRTLPPIFYGGYVPTGEDVKTRIPDYPKNDSSNFDGDDWIDLIDGGVSHAHIHDELSNPNGTKQVGINGYNQVQIGSYQTDSVGAKVLIDYSKGASPAFSVHQKLVGEAYTALLGEFLKNADYHSGFFLHSNGSINQNIEKPILGGDFKYRWFSGLDSDDDLSTKTPIMQLDDYGNLINYGSDDAVSTTQAGIGTAGGIYAGKKIKTEDTTDATAPNTGSFQTKGGAYVEKSLWVGEDVTIDADNIGLVLGEDQDMSLSYQTSGIGLIDLSLQNQSDLHIDCGGTGATAKTVVLDVPVWDDLRIVPGSFDFPGSTDPTLQDWQPGGSGTTFKVYKFDKGQQGYFTCQLPHGYKQGENISVHAHWTPGNRGTTEGTAVVAWKVDYSWANIEGVFGASATADLSDACQSTNHEHLMTPEATITGTNKEISSMLMCRIYRDSTGDTWSGTGANGPALLEVDFHYPIDTPGSRQTGTK